MGIKENRERDCLLHHARRFLGLAEEHLESGATIPAVLCSVKGVLCALAGMLVMRGKRCELFFTETDSDIPTILSDDRILNMRDSFLVEFVSAEERYDGELAALLQCFLENSSIARSLAQSSDPSHQATVKNFLTENLLPWAHEILTEVERLKRRDATTTPTF